MATILFIIILKARRLQLVEKEQTWKTRAISVRPHKLRFTIKVTVSQDLLNTKYIFFKSCNNFLLMQLKISHQLL